MVSVMPHRDIETVATGYIIVDELQNTTADGIYALGDVCGKVELTPMAISAGRKLAHRLFEPNPASKADYDAVPTVICSPSPIPPRTSSTRNGHRRGTDSLGGCLWGCPFPRGRAGGLFASTDRYVWDDRK